MIHFIQGAKIQESQFLSEGFKIEENSIISVLNAENIMKVITDFVTLHCKEEFFLFLEVPCSADEEKKFNVNGGRLHKNIYYLDNVSSEEVLKVLKRYEDILVNDGLTAFGVGTREAEIGKYKYNAVSAFSQKPELLVNVFLKNNIPENTGLVTPWDIIDETNPGECSRYEDTAGRTIYDVVDALMKLGLYKAKTVED